MNKFLSFFALLLCACSVFAQGEDFSKYKLKEHNTVEEFQNAYLNKIITYLPDFSSGISSSQQMGLGNEPINFRVISITGKTKKNRDWQDMEWTIEEVDGDLRKTFNVHSGNYTQEIYYYNKDKEFLLRELQFYLLDEWKEDHKSEIGMLFESPLVKAKYMVVDVYLSIEKGIAIKELMKMYTVQNTITGKQYNYNSEKAHSLCFEEDLSGEYHASLARVEKPENPTGKQPL